MLEDLKILILRTLSAQIEKRTVFIHFIKPTTEEYEVSYIY